jgi:Tir chaperone protein (CesT) family
LLAAEPGDAIMKDVNHAIAILRDLTGLPVLELNANGHLELIFDDKISIDLVKIDDHHIELSSPLDINDLENVARLQTLLTANYHGSGTGFARIALDRRDRSALICERIDVTPLDPGQFEARLLGFVKYVAFWLSGEADELLPTTDHTPAPASDPSLMVIRS